MGPFNFSLSPKFLCKKLQKKNSVRRSEIVRVDQKGDTAPRYIAYPPQVSTTPEEWLAQHGHLRGETEMKQ